VPYRRPQLMVEDEYSKYAIIYEILRCTVY